MSNMYNEEDFNAFLLCTITYLSIKCPSGLVSSSANAPATPSQAGEDREPELPGKGRVTNPTGTSSSIHTFGSHLLPWCSRSDAEGHHRCALPSTGRMAWCRLRVCFESSVSCSSVKLSGLAAPSKELPQLELGDNMSCRRSSWTIPESLFTLPLWFPSSSWSLSSLARKLMYFIARRKISFLLSFLSGGWVGMSLRSSAKAPLTFCCLHLSRLLVKMRRTTFV